MSKQIHFAGVSRVKGVLTFRTAASPARAQQLAKLGDTDIDMIMLRGEVTTKSQAAKQLLGRDFSDNAEVLALLTKVATDDNPFKRKTRQVKITVPNQALVELVGARVKVERGPFGKVFPEIKMTPKQAEQIRNEWNAKHKSVA